MAVIVMGTVLLPEEMPRRAAVQLSTLPDGAPSRCASYVNSMIIPPDFAGLQAFCRIGSRQKISPYAPYGCVIVAGFRLKETDQVRLIFH
jgi:hypothetical protein